MNVRILLTATILPLLISGCSVFGWKSVEPIQISKKAEERIRLNLPDPAPVKGREIEWIIITPANAEQVWKDLKEKNIDIVLIGLTDDNYENLAVTIAELRNYIAQQKQIIIKYREYYEPAPAAPSK